MKKIGLYISSRNNYLLLEEFILRNHKSLEKYLFINVDDHSSDEQVELGKDICARYSIPFVKNKKRGLQWACKTAIDYMSDMGFEYLVWMTHDSHTITEDFMDKFNSYVEAGSLKDFGIVGFNILGPQCGVTRISNIKPNQNGMLGRAPLSKLSGRGGWYRTPDMKLPWETWGGFGKAIAVESPVDMMLAINVNKFKEHIEVSDNYHLFCAFDDICMQFLNNGIYNVTIPELQVWHDQHIKEGKVPVKSASHAKKGDEFHFGNYGKHLEYWKQTWGWERDDVRNTFPSERYEGTLIGEFYNSVLPNKPIKSFDL